MKNSKNNSSTWRQVKVVVLLPLAVFLWVTGWTLYWIGDHETSSKTAQKKTAKEYVVHKKF
ncbi:hypothetical protein MUO71_05145 [Candidatus Bathyarchaeota archaeon]|nr:hypothetical protein [Candidatus Bathyarchaeota archaeon]